MAQTRMFAGLALAVAAAGAQARTGPDVIIGDLDQVFRWGTANGYVAYSNGTVLCNQGDQIANWVRNTADHPVIAGNLFKVSQGRIEQIGVSWVKHTFFADIASFCGTCQFPPDYNGTQLGVGCADAYSAAFNGELMTLGPRSQVNGFTGVFPYPADLTGYPSATPTIGRRIQVALADADPAQNPGARYIAEAQIVAADEAASGNGANSVSWREFSVSAGTFNWTPAAGSITHRENPAIQAWQAIDPLVRLEGVDIPGEGRLWLASRVTEESPGVWRYVYAVQNINSQRGVGSVGLGLSPCAAVDGLQQRLPRYHSGEPWGNDAWVFGRTGALAAWSTPTNDPNTSALRWGTLVTLEFRTDRPPRNGVVRLGLFGPGLPDSVTAGAWTPGGSADFNADGFLDFFDYDDFVGAFEAGDMAADTNGDGFLDFFDYDSFVELFEAGC